MARLAQLLVLCALALCAASAAHAKLAPGADLEEDAPGALELSLAGLAADGDACLAQDDASASQQCGLSLRQLRAGTQSSEPADTPQVSDVHGLAGGAGIEDEKAAAETWRAALGAPGGWGEAAQWASTQEAVGDTGESSEAGVHGLANMTAGGNVKVLYHQTSYKAAHLIMKHGFRPGRSGWCGGGIYFATDPAATNRKAIGQDSQKGYIIAVKVNVGRVKYLGQTCEFHMNGGLLHSQHFDSIHFDPGDGPEFVVYSNARILGTWHHH